MKSLSSKWITTNGLVGLVALSLGYVVAATAPAKAALSSTDLVKELQAGGYVVYMRHTKTNKNEEDLDHSDLSNCATQRNLDDRIVTDSLPHINYCHLNLGAKLR